jgi:alpha-L-fucosidase
MPLWPVSDVGLKAVAHYYNQSVKDNKGKNEAVVFAKILTDEQKEAVVWDVEKGVPDGIQSKPWQTCTCLGQWHYSKEVYDKNWYKSPKSVVHMLIDIISKNGNLLLSVPMRGNGTIDDKEQAILEEIARWMDINKEGVFGTRPWKRFGEGPVAESSNPLHAQGFNEGKHQPYTARDIRFVTKGKVLYAHVLKHPEDGKVIIQSLSSNNALYPEAIKQVELIGCKTPLKFNRTAEGLVVEIPADAKVNEISLLLKIS